MEYEFFLKENMLPVGFKYPEAYIEFVSKHFSDYDPWHFYYQARLEFAFNGLKSRYPSRTIVPFARRRDNDDIACFDAGVMSDNPKILIIHDWASEGWEGRGELNSFLDWVELAKQESQEWKEFWKNQK